MLKLLTRKRFPCTKIRSVSLKFRFGESGCKSFREKRKWSGSKIKIKKKREANIITRDMPPDDLSEKFK